MGGGGLDYGGDDDAEEGMGVFLLMTEVRKEGCGGSTGGSGATVH